LREEDWTYDKLNYFAFGYKPSYVGVGFYPTNSVANDIQELQLTANHLLSDAINGQRMGMFGVGMAPQGVDTNQAYVEYQPGSIIQGIQGASFYAPSVNISYTLPLLQEIKNQANETARVSDALRGTQSRVNKTATQSEFEAMGSRKAIDEYIETFGEAVIEMFEFMQIVLHKNFSKWAKKFGKALELDDSPDAKAYLGYPVLWSLKVASIGATAGAQFGIAQQLLAMSQDPAFKFDKYKLGKAILSYAKRMGMTIADELQYEDDPVALLEVLADELAQIGVDPNSVIAATLAAIEMASPGGVGGMEAAPMSPGVPGGTIPDAGMAPPGIGAGTGELGFNQSGVM
jgi:hypothetical protein